MTKRFTIACLCASVGLAMSDPPRLVLRCETRDAPSLAATWVRGETVDMEVQIVNYARPIDLTGYTVTLHVQTNGQSRSTSFQASGSAGMRGNAAAATNGWMWVRVDVDAIVPESVRAASWTLEAAPTNGHRVMRAAGPLTIRGTAAADAQAPLPTGEADVLRGEIAAAFGASGSVWRAEWQGADAASLSNAEDYADSVASTGAYTSAGWVDPDYWSIGTTPTYRSLGTPSVTNTVGDVIVEVRTVAPQTVADYELYDDVRRGYPDGIRAWTFDPSGCVSWISSNTVRFANATCRVEVARSIGSTTKTLVLPPYTTSPSTVTNAIGYVPGTLRHALVAWHDARKAIVAADTNGMLSAYYWQTTNVAGLAYLAGAATNPACYMADVVNLRALSPGRSATGLTRWHGTVISPLTSLQAWHANDGATTGAGSARIWTGSTGSTIGGRIASRYTPEDASLSKDWVGHQLLTPISVTAALPPSRSDLAEYVPSANFAGMPAWIVGQYRDVIPVTLDSYETWHPSVDPILSRYARPLVTGDSGSPVFLILDVDGATTCVLLGMATYANQTGSGTIRWHDEIATTAAHFGGPAPTYLDLSGFTKLEDL